MSESRETRKQILDSAVEQFLDHLDESYNEDENYIGAVFIATEMNVVVADDSGDEAVIPVFWCSNENAIWQRGFFECLADYKKLPAQD